MYMYTNSIRKNSVERKREMLYYRMFQKMEFNSKDYSLRLVCYFSNFGHKYS